MAKKYIFSGHESFQCRQLWLKKGYDLIKSGKSFNDEDAVVVLGVGKNMVTSIRFWMKAFDLLSADDVLTPFADKLLADDGYDPYLEDEASLWLLHYQLVKRGFSSSYSIVFNELRREKMEFTRDNYIAYIKRKSSIEKSFQANEKTLLEDFSVLSKMYLRSDAQVKDKEDNFSGLLTELDLVKSFSKGREDFFLIENSERREIPDEVILFAILDTEGFDLSINLINLEQDYNGVGTVFAMNRSGILAKIESIAAKHRYIIFNDQAGVKEIQFKKKPSALSILDKYYAN
ncbi:DUF4007 family protein [Flavitalea sp.]|nr:DUF4007 family protein [Flavitalea sp.]